MRDIMIDVNEIFKPSLHYRTFPITIPVQYYLLFSTQNKTMWFQKNTLYDSLTSSNKLK